MSTLGETAIGAALIQSAASVALSLPGSIAVNNAGTSPSQPQYVAFAQQFADGAVPKGADITLLVGNKQLPTQMDVTARYADGSVKSAVLTVAAGKIAAGATLKGRLALDTTPPPAPLPVNDILRHGYDLTVSMQIVGLGSVVINGADALAKAIASHTAKIIRHGANATEIQVDVPVGKGFHVTLDVTSYADGSNQTDIRFRNDLAMTSQGGTIEFSSIRITQSGQTKFSHGPLTQYQYQTWRQIISSGPSAAPTLNVVHDINYLEQLGIFQNYDLYSPVDPKLIASEATALKSADWTNILGVNGVAQYMPTTGGRPDIGPTTLPNALWLITQNSTAAQYALGQAEAAGSVPWHFYDAAHGHYLSVKDYPSIWIDSRGPLQPTQLPSDATGWTPDTAHQPDLAYTAYMLTGDTYFLDQLNAQASWAIAVSWNDPRENARGIVANEAEQVRAQAWSLRQIDEAAYANPNGSAERSYFTEISRNNWKSLAQQIPARTKLQGQLHGFIPGVYREANAISTFNQDYFATTAAQAALFGDQNARAVLKWEANFLSGRFLSPDFDPHNGYAFNFMAYAADGSNIKTWAAAQKAMVASGNAWAPGQASGGDYAELALQSNAELISVFAGGNNPSDHVVAANAMRAYGWLLSDNDPFLRADLQLQIVPRLADGSLLSASDMFVIRSVGAAPAFTGQNVFIYDDSTGGNTLRAAAGASVLIDHTKSGDTLIGGRGDDYLIGGDGPNSIKPGNGNDYVQGGGGADVFFVNPAAVGHMEIADFTIGLDKLKLLSTAAGHAQDIIRSATTDSYGNTLLVISPTYSVTLDGITPDQLKPAMFE